MSDKLIGKNLDRRYELEEVLGTGAMGAVYRATQTAVDRVVAIKTLHAFLQEREDFQARFEIEAKAIARLHHPNCITLYDFGYDPRFDVFYMAVEYVEGKQLADLMVDPVPYEDVMSICYQVAEALDHAHHEGILHRDLKPENIMIQRSETSGRPMVKVLDFGLARLYEPDLDPADEILGKQRYKQITKAGQVYGTPAYMSPEQCKSREELTPATDLYALGTMMFELLEGRLPFYSESTAELLMMQMTEEPPRMERLDVPADVKDMVFSMMQKDPTARPQSAKEVMATLFPYVRLDASQEMRVVPSDSGEFRIVATGEFDAPRLPEPTPDLELSQDELRAAQTSRRAIWAMVAGALIVGALGAFAYFAYSKSGSETNSDSAQVDGTTSGVADSTARAPKETGTTGSAPVEVAAGDGATKQRTGTHKGKAKAKPKKSHSPSTKHSASSTKPRAKTLKLTY